MLRKTSKASGPSGSRRPGTMRGLLRRTLGDGGDLRTLRASVRDVFRRGSKQEVRGTRGPTSCFGKLPSSKCQGYYHMRQNSHLTQPGSLKNRAPDNTWFWQDGANAEGTADATKDVGQVGSVQVPKLRLPICISLHCLIVRMRGDMVMCEHV